jgi:DNA invertase Pin-like site-specific DNA recombinase
LIQDRTRAGLKAAGARGKSGDRIKISKGKGMKKE